MAERFSAGRGAAFTVRFDGVALSSDLENRIEAAVRKAVLSELADLDLTEGLSVRAIAAEEGNGGGTKGIVFIPDVAPPRR